jgi:hypothetical protein
MGISEPGKVHINKLRDLRVFSRVNYKILHFSRQLRNVRSVPKPIRKYSNAGNELLVSVQENINCCQLGGSFFNHLALSYNI